MSSNLPSLPKLPGDIVLEVFTHRSLRFPGAPINEDSEYGDNERLAILGEKAMETAVTDTLFRKRPMLKAFEIEVSIQFLSALEVITTITAVTTQRNTIAEEYRDLDRQLQIA